LRVALEKAVPAFPSGCRCRVAHAEEERAAVALPLLNLRLQHNSPWEVNFTAFADEVEQNRRRRIWIAHDDLRHLVVHHKGELQFLGEGALGHQVDGLLEQRPDRKLDFLEVEPPEPIFE